MLLCLPFATSPFSTSFQNMSVWEKQWNWRGRCLALHKAYSELNWQLTAGNKKSLEPHQSWVLLRHPIESWTQLRFQLLLNFYEDLVVLRLWDPQWKSWLYIPFITTINILVLSTLYYHPHHHHPHHHHHQTCNPCWSAGPSGIKNFQSRDFRDGILQNPGIPGFFGTGLA